MPRNPTPKETYTPPTPSNRVVERMKTGEGLIEAERKEGITYDQAEAEADKVADDALLAHLEKLTGPDAVRKLGEDLLKAGFERVPAGETYQTEWRHKTSHVLLKSPEGTKKFPREARRLASMDKMLCLRLFLGGGIYNPGTPRDFRQAMRVAFEAGVSFSESERTQKTGRRKNDEFTDALNALFRETATLPPREYSLKTFPVINEEKVALLCKRYGKTCLNLSTLQNRLGEWLRVEKESAA